MILNNGCLKSEQKKWNCLHCTSPTLQNNDLFIHFLTFLPGSGSGLGKNRRIRADPDPKPWYLILCSCVVNVKPLHCRWRRHREDGRREREGYPDRPHQPEDQEAARHRLKVRVHQLFLSKTSPSMGTWKWNFQARLWQTERQTDRLSIDVPCRQSFI